MFSPVVEPPTICILLQLALCKGWNIQQLDLNKAFLNKDIQKEVFITQPEGFVNEQFPTHVYKLKRPYMGLSKFLKFGFLSIVDSCNS